MTKSIALCASTSTLDWWKLACATGRSLVVRERYAMANPVNRTTIARTIRSAAAFSLGERAMRNRPIL